ncbi:MAG: cysteine hydrolase family protein [Clostridium sp.]
MQAKIKEYADRGDRIIFTRDTHEENYLDTAEGKKLPVIHCIKGRDGWQIIPELQVEGCEYIDKPTFGWLNWSGFGEHDEIELVGVCTDICVVSNAFDFESHVSRGCDFGRCRLLCRGYAGKT